MVTIASTAKMGDDQRQQPGDRGPARLAAHELPNCAHLSRGETRQHATRVAGVMSVLMMAFIQTCSLGSQCRPWHSWLQSTECRQLQSTAGLVAIAVPPLAVSPGAETGAASCARTAEIMFLSARFVTARPSAESAAGNVQTGGDHGPERDRQPQLRRRTDEAVIGLEPGQAGRLTPGVSVR
jgi:hypothetical protein